MNSWSYSSIEPKIDERYDGYRFYTETIEVPHMSALAFFEAGEKDYEGKRMYWRNRENTFSFAGLGHAHVIEASGADRFEEVQRQWHSLCSELVNEETAVQPVLFGGFSFDPQNEEKTVWTNFSPAYFVVPQFQLIVRNDCAYISINFITKEETTYTTFDQLRTERDKLIHRAQVEEPADHEKPIVVRKTELGKNAYLQSIRRITDAIKAKEAEKVVIARVLQLSFEKPAKAAAVLQQILKEQPESFLFGLEAESQFFFGATPERLVKVTKNQALSTCLAGSIPRGSTAEEDAKLGSHLLTDPKNRSEHAYVVDMISSVFEQHCEEPKVPVSPKLMKIRDIQHLYTPVSGTLKPDSALLDLVRDLHPTPALGGEPKNKALQLIREQEMMDRGLYAAPIGWMDAEGNGEFAVAIRSALIDGSTAFLYAGGGIVESSTPESEYAETWVKFRPMLRALGGQLNDES